MSRLLSWCSIVTVMLAAAAPAGASVLPTPDGFAEVGSDAAADWAVSNIPSSVVRPAAAGDLNGDGTGDLLVHTGAGDYLVFGGPALGTLDAGALGAHGSRITYPEQWQDRPVRLERAGDVNGDGRDDVVASLVKAFEGELCAVVMFGAAEPVVPAFDDLGDRGFEVRCRVEDHVELTAAGDVDGDGRDDLVGVLTETLAESSARILLVQGRTATAPVDIAALGPDGWTIASPRTGRVRPLGDYDRDGYADLVFDGFTANTGYILWGDPADPPADATGLGGRATAITSPSGPRDTWYDGFGDVNGDGFPDLRSDLDVVFGTGTRAPVTVPVDASRTLRLFEQNQGPQGDIDGDGRTDRDFFPTFSDRWLLGGSTAAVGFLFGPSTGGVVDAADPFDAAMSERGFTLMLPDAAGSLDYGAGVGDVTGDGTDDVAVGLGTSATRGSVRVVRGWQSGTSVPPVPAPQITEFSGSFQWITWITGTSPWNPTRPSDDVRVRFRLPRVARVDLAVQSVFGGGTLRESHRMPPGSWAPRLDLRSLGGRGLTRAGAYRATFTPYDLQGRRGPGKTMYFAVLNNKPPG